MRDRIGIFSGFGESRLEVVSKVLVPYNAQRMPLQGAFLVVGHDDLQGRPSGLLGRVTRAEPIGELFTSAGEDYLVDLVRMGHAVPEEVKAGRLRYRISLRLLGQVSQREDGRIEYTPAIRQLPHVGAAVGFPSEEVMTFIARGCPSAEEDPGPEIGYLAVGDLAFDGTERTRGRKIPVNFRMGSLVGRRTAVFARAGMGKSNFTKVLLTRLYNSSAVAIPGTLVIDPEGEYAFANESEPGLLDVAGLADRIIVFTEREDFDPRYRSAVGGNCLVNFADLDPVEAVNNLLPEEKQNTVFANLLRSLDPARWKRLIALLATGRYSTRSQEIARIFGKKQSGEGDVVVGAIINNLVPALDRLHSPKSTLLSQVMESLRAGKIVVLDVSMLSARDAKLISAWILRTVFANNQEAYTTVKHHDGLAAASRRLIPCMAVFEEAQFYLGDERLREDSAFVRWFKEGRKFQLGSILVTQQPGAIGPELISQCDNFFVFHLLSQIDLDALAKANLHYSGDVATTIGHEPIPGNCYLWSGRGLSFVTCARILHFADLASNPPVRGSAAKQLERPATVEKGSEVSLPVKSVKLGSRREESTVALEMLREILAEEPSVFLFRGRIQGLESTPESNGSYLSAVWNYIERPLRQRLREAVASGSLAVEAAGRFPIEGAAIARVLADEKHSPISTLLVDEKGQKHLVFYDTFLTSCEKLLRGEVGLTNSK